MFDNKIHITPQDYIHELEEKDCKDYLFIAPTGERLTNEMSDVYYQKDAFVPYHEHSKGYETFLSLGEPELVSKEELSQIRPKGGSIAQFCFKGITCNQKVGRHETGGEKEIWEFVLEKGLRIEVQSPHPDWDLFVVKEGQVQFTVLGETFTASPRDIVNIPPYTPYCMVSLTEGAVIQANNLRGLGLRLFEIVEKKLQDDMDAAAHWDEIKDLFPENGFCITKIARE